MKYFRTYPWGLQLLLFTLMIFTLMSGITAIIYSLLPKLTGFMPIQMQGLTPNSPAALINATLVVEGVFNLSVFSLSAYLFAYLTHPEPNVYLGLRKPGKKIQPVLAILLMLGAMPVLEGLSTLISMLPFSPQMKAEQHANDEMINAFLNINNMSSFIKVFVVMAIVPGLGEEMFFRGVLLRLVRKGGDVYQARGVGIPMRPGMVVPILFTATLFAFVHSNVFGFVSILLAGVLLAVIYNLTGSLWCSILAHIFFNGTQVILSYAATFSPAIKRYMNSTDTTTAIVRVAAGAVVFAISFYLLLKNRTPLPANWADDSDRLPPPRMREDITIEQ